METERKRDCESRGESLYACILRDREQKLSEHNFTSMKIISYLWVFFLQWLSNPHCVFIFFGIIALNSSTGISKISLIIYIYLFDNMMSDYLFHWCKLIFLKDHINVQLNIMGGVRLYFKLCFFIVYISIMCCLFVVWSLCAASSLRHHYVLWD